MELTNLKEGEGFFTDCFVGGCPLKNAYIHRHEDKIYVFSDEESLAGGHWYKFQEKKFKAIRKKYIYCIGNFDSKTPSEYYGFKLILPTIYELWE